MKFEIVSTIPSFFFIIVIDDEVAFRLSLNRISMTEFLFLH